MGYDLLIVLAAGVLLAITLPLLTAVRAVILTVFILGIIIGINFWLYLHAGLVLPLATSFFMIVTAFSLNMSYGYFVESRSKRELVHLFGTYAPPELVDEMAKDPKSYSMEAQTRELTVMFCDMRGFTQLSEGLEPAQLQALLNRLFSRLTQVIRSNHQGTIDKYMGDCVMAFWGAPVLVQDHAARAVAAALEMIVAVEKINQEHRQKSLPEVGVGIGLNTGSMHVGDMGSDIRKAYTVIGDAVNLGSRLEALTRVYGVDIVVSEYTRKKSDQFKWLELDRIRVKGKQEAVTIYTPFNTTEDGNLIKQEIIIWNQFLKAYRSQNWDVCDVLLLNVGKISSRKTLHDTYIRRIQELRKLPFDPNWDGVYRFDTK
jgi:adenylate cyclase